MLHSIFFIFGRYNPPYIIFCFINTYLISALLCIHASTHFEFQLHLSFVIAGVSWVWFCSQVTALILKWKNDTNPQSCSSAPLPSPVVPASHSKQKHALFSLTHMHKNTQMSSSLFHLLFHMCLCLSLTHCPLFGIRVRASISTVVNTSTLP